MGSAGPVHLELPALLALAWRVITEEVHAGLAAAGYPDIRTTDGYTFQLLASTGGATGVEVAAHLGITKQSAGALLDQLERRGYVERAADPVDGRARPARLTARGWDCIGVGVGLWDRVEQDARNRYGTDDVATLRRVLEGLVGDRGGFGPPLRLRPPT